jgi:hypothetical protein
MRALLIVMAFAAGSLFAQTLGVERRQDLGFGFHRDVIAEATPHSFEAVGHFEYLFYRDRKLCQLDECAVAPSGDTIIYQDGPSGNIFVFRRKDGRITQLTKKFPGLVDRFVWHEQAGNVSAFVTRDSQAPLSSGKWIMLRIPQKT